jgi:hypothetical protein
VDIKAKSGQPKAQGNAVAEYSDYVARACSMQYGKDARWNAIESEKREEDAAFGVVNYTEDSTACDDQYGLRGPEQHAIKTVSDADSNGPKRGE